MTVPLSVDDKNFYVSEELWNDFETSKDAAAYSSMKALATFTVERGGAFVIHRAHEGDTSVLNNLHDLYELKEFFDKVDQRRANLAL